MPEENNTLGWSDARAIRDDRKFIGKFEELAGVGTQA